MTKSRVISHKWWMLISSNLRISFSITFSVFKLIGASWNGQLLHPRGLSLNPTSLIIISGWKRCSLQSWRDCLLLSGIQAVDSWGLKLSVRPTIIGNSGGSGVNHGGDREGLSSPKFWLRGQQCWLSPPKFKLLRDTAGSCFVKPHKEYIT